MTITARWNNTGGDVRVHILTDDSVITPEGRPWSKPFATTTPKCGTSVYHGGWSIVEVGPDRSVPGPYRLCDRCFPAVQREVRKPEANVDTFNLGHYEAMQLSLALRLARDLMAYDPDHRFLADYDLLNLNSVSSLLPIFSRGDITVTRTMPED